MSTIHLAVLVIGQVLACHSPNPLEWATVLVIVGGILASLGIGAAGIVSAASTLVTMILAGSSFDAIVAAMLNTIATIGPLLEVVAQLVYGVKAILGC